MSRVKGTVANNGCPDESEAVMMKLNEYGSTMFDSGKASLKSKPINFRFNN
jgi:hypothetical protein